MMTVNQLEAAALKAHQAGTPWADFWRNTSGDVRALELHELHAVSSPVSVAGDTKAGEVAALTTEAVAVLGPKDDPGYRALVWRLLALVVSGDIDGMRPVPATWELDDDQAATNEHYPTPPVCLGRRSGKQQSRRRRFQ